VLDVIHCLPQIITSCNSTREELAAQFCGVSGTIDAQNPVGGSTDTRWRLVDWVKYPTFRFGGVEGSKVCTLAFHKQLDRT
jgi:EEF1A lysine methyltransferase 2